MAVQEALVVVKAAKVDSGVLGSSVVLAVDLVSCTTYSILCKRIRA